MILRIEFFIIREKIWIQSVRKEVKKDGLKSEMIVKKLIV